MATGEPNVLSLPEPPIFQGDLFTESNMYKTSPKEHFEPVKLHFAINKDNFEEAREQILRGIDVNFVVHGNTPLMLAMLREQYDISLLLIRSGANVTIPEIYAWRRQPIHLAARDGQNHLVELMLERGASAQAADGMQMTPLHWAAAYGCTSVVKILLNHGAHINPRDDRGRTPLFRAACSNHADIVKLLYEEGGSVNTQDVFGWSPLHQAALCSLPVVSELLALGARPNVQNLRGDTPLHVVMARQSPHNLLTLSRTDLQYYTRDLKITSTCTDRLKTFICDRDLLLVLLDFNCDVNIKNAEGKTPFDVAVVNSNVMFIRWLVLVGGRVTLPVSSFPDGWPLGLVTNSNLCDFLRVMGAHRVQRLVDLAKAAIRQNLCPVVGANIDVLPLPNQLKKYLHVNLEL